MALPSPTMRERFVVGGSIASTLVLGLLVLGFWRVGGADPADVVPSAERSAHLAAMKARTDGPAPLPPMTTADLLALPRPPRASTRAQLAEITTLEGRGVSVPGFVARVDPKRDGDFHVQITTQPRTAASATPRPTSSLPS